MNIILQETASTSGTITATNTQQDLVLVHDAGATVSLTIAFPSNPTNSQMFSMSSTGGITTLSLTAAVGTISNLITTLVAGNNATYMFVSTTSKWIKIR